MGLFGKDKYKQFWDWFSANQELYMNMPPLDDNAIQADYEAVDLLFDELHSRLKKIDKYVCFEFSQILKDGSREFVISADGIFSAAPKVQQLVATAPKLNNWNIIAFRQGKEGDHVVFEDYELSAKDVRFNYSFNDENRVDLVLFVKGYDDADKRVLHGAMFVLVDSMVGEYNMMTKVGFIEIYDSKQATKPKPRPLDELPALLESRTSNPIG